jgi:hypothetical protein
VGGNQSEHFARLSMTTEGLLGEHDRVIHSHFKHAAAGGSQTDLRFWPTIPQRGRQTDGPGLVVSDGAEFDRETHLNGGKRKNDEGLKVGRNRLADNPHFHPPAFIADTALP